MALASAWQYVWHNTALDLRQRYAGSLLGPLWLVLTPIVQIAIYSVVFTGIMAGRISGGDGGPATFALYLCAGIMPWSAFAALIARSASLLRTSSGFILNNALPEEYLFLRSAMDGGVLALISAVLVVVAAAILGEPHPSTWALIPAVVLLFMLCAAGIGMAVGVCGVFVRDMEPSIDLVLRLWFWVTPIVYVPSILPESLSGLVRFNPAYPYIHAMQSLVLNNDPPGVEGWLVMVAIASVSVSAGWCLLAVLRSTLRDAL